MRELVGADGYAAVQELALAAMIADIRDDLREFGVEFEEWFSEASLTRSGAVGAALARLAALGHSYEKEGALWLRSSDFGDSEDRVLVRANGQQTYFAPDLAYHLNKFSRGFARLIDVWGADHHGYIPRMRAGLRALGADGDSFEVCLMQFVSLFRGGEKVPMGKRDGQFVTLRQLRAEVGNDACRVFYLMRSHDQPLDFDLELAKSRSNDNPVYYMQYAHARVASVMKQLGARGLQYDSRPGLRQPRAPRQRARGGGDQGAGALPGDHPAGGDAAHAAHAGALPARARPGLPHLVQRRALHRRRRRSCATRGWRWRWPRNR